MTDFFQNKTPVIERLKTYGFSEEDGVWAYHVRILEGEFELTVTILPTGEVKTRLLECELGEPYTLHLVEEAGGEFVGKVRAAYEAALGEIAESCFEGAFFKQPQTENLLAHAREKYGTEPEYLWEKFPDNAVLRRKDTGKWYAAVLTARRKSLGFAGEGTMEIVDLRADPAEIVRLVDGVRILPGWHMNKKHWISVPLDGRIPFGEIATLLENSFMLAK